MKRGLARLVLLAGWIGPGSAPADPPHAPVVRMLRAGAVVERREWEAGLEVLGRPFTTRLDGLGRVRWTHGDSTPADLRSLGAPAWPALATRLASGSILGPERIVELLGSSPALARGATVARGPELVVFAPPFRAPRVAYWLRLAHDHRTGRTLRVVVDATTGAILSVDDDVRFDRLARVFRENPVVTPDPEVVVLGSLPQGATQLDGPDLFARGCVDLGLCRPVGDAWIHGCDPVPTALADQDGDFLAYERPDDDASADDPAAEVQLYHHASRALEAFRTLSGDPGFRLATRPLQLLANVRLSDLSDPNVWCDGRTHPDPPELVPLDFAFYTPEGTWGTGSPTEMLVFGQGTTLDLSYDGELVYHELTHAVVHAVSDIDWTVPDATGMDLGQFAMNEGFADYFAATISGNAEIAEYAAPAFAGPVRDLDDARTCPHDLTGESHDDSRIWSSALWEVRRGLSADDRAAMDGAVFTVLASLGSWDTFESTQALLVDELGVAIGAGASDLAASVFVARGLDGCDGRVQPVRVGEVKEALYLWGTDRFFLDPLIPAAVQLRFELDREATEIGVQIEESAPIVTGPSSTAGTDRRPEVWLLLKPGPEAIEWSWEPVGTHDAPLEARVTFSDEAGRPGSGSIPGPFPAGVYHLQLANAGDGWEARGIAVTASPGSERDAGMDAGQAATVAVGGGGCNCGAPGRAAATELLVVPAAAAAVVLRRRRKRQILDVNPGHSRGV